MPLLADSIVDCGRRTLTNAINLADSWGQDRKGAWSGAKVVYGKERWFQCISLLLEMFQLTTFVC